MALDLGSRRIGMALSDELRLTAQGLETMQRTNIREDLSRLSALASDRGVTMFLVGNPVNMNGSEGGRSAWARQFAEKLTGRTGLPARLWDERFTTVEAERVLREGGVAGPKRKLVVDRLAAVILLESYLDSAEASGTAEGQAG